VHRKYIPIDIQQDATLHILFIFGNCSTCIGWYFHPSSGANTTVLLPYFAQLAKVFSQGKYYVGGPRKVQICHNCLLTNTLIMRFCLFIVFNNCCLSRTVKGTCTPICLFTVMVSARKCLLASSLSKSNNPLCTEIILLVEIQI
jgi:hypothetical protein